MLLEQAHMVGPSHTFTVFQIGPLSLYLSHLHCPSLWVHLGTCYRVQLMDYIIERFQDMEFEPPLPNTKLKRKGGTMRGYFIIEPSKSWPTIIFSMFFSQTRRERFCFVVLFLLLCFSVFVFPHRETCPHFGSAGVVGRRRCAVA